MERHHVRGKELASSSVACATWVGLRPRKRCCPLPASLLCRAAVSAAFPDETVRSATGAHNTIPAHDHERGTHP